MERYSGCYKPPSLSSVGAHTYVKSCFHPSLKIGRYCAIAAEVRVMPDNHPMERLSTCGFDYSSAAVFRAAETDFASPVTKTPPKRSKGLPEIGNDVWIGHDVILARGIKIGDGAVIGTKSIVTKDVPPYAIVAGAPAAIKKYRFNHDVIHKLINLGWWRYRFTDFKNAPTTDVGKFIKELSLMQENGDIQPFEEERISVHEKFVELA